MVALAGQVHLSGANKRQQSDIGKIVVEHEWMGGENKRKIGTISTRRDAAKQGGYLFTLNQ